jgi:hypothetical protein
MRPRGGDLGDIAYELLVPGGWEQHHELALRMDVSGQRARLENVGGGASAATSPERSATATPATMSVRGNRDAGSEVIGERRCKTSRPCVKPRARGHRSEWVALAMSHAART